MYHHILSDVSRVSDQPFGPNNRTLLLSHITYQVVANLDDITETIIYHTSPTGGQALWP